MHIDFEVNKIRASCNGNYGDVRVSGSKEFCNKILELCNKEFGKNSIN